MIIPTLEIINLDPDPDPDHFDLTFSPKLYNLDGYSF